MPINSLFRLQDLDGFLNSHLGALQKSNITRHILKPGADLQTYTSPRYQNWNITNGLTVYVNQKPVITEDSNKFTQKPVIEALSFFNATGTIIKKSIILNKLGQIKFVKPLKLTDEVLADFNFRFLDQEGIHQELYHGLVDVQTRVYQNIDPLNIPSAFVNLVIDCAMLHFFESQLADSSMFYDYSVQEQKNSKSQVAKGLEARIKAIEDGLLKQTKQALWWVGNGRARQVISIKNRWVPSSAIQSPNDNFDPRLTQDGGGDDGGGGGY